jgi:hypothetical protein
MDALLLLLLIVLVLAILIGLPLFVIIYPYKKLRKTRFKKYAFIIPLLIIGLFVYLFYDSIYPSDSFYEDDFVSITNLTFPQSGIILAKEADYPDQHGHYTSVAVVSLSTTDYKALFEKVINDKTFETDTIIGESSGYRKVTEGIKDSDIKKIMRKGKMVIGFLNDNRRIIIERHLSDNY